MFLLYHAYVYLEFLILACTIYILAPYQLSLNLGRSKGYIQSISSGRSLPSMNTFLDICDYFHLTPREFFSPEITNPSLLHEVISNLETCSEDDLILINEILLRLKKNES